MNVELDSEAQQLQDSLRRLFSAESTPAPKRALAGDGPGWNAALWAKLQEFGLGLLLLPEDMGGLAQRPVSLLPVMQEIGRALSVEPLLALLVGQRGLLAASGAAERSPQLARLLAGAPLIAWAHAEAAGRHAMSWIETTARTEGAHWILDGAKTNVLHGATAQALVVTARTDAGEPGLFVVQPDGPGVQIDDRRLIDGTPVAQLRLHSARAQRLDAADGSALAAVEAAHQLGMAAVCAEAVGVCELAMAQTIEYVKLRKQFDRTLGQKQAVRHRVAEMQVALEMVRSAALGALLALEEQDADRRGAELERAKMLVGRHGVAITQHAVQLHGGVGMTVEFLVGHCLRRMTVIEHLFGDAHGHAASLARRLASTYQSSGRTPG
ncbi:MAG TPA: acyl-CoA dehydrogenase family protein, partial [Pseudorhodoferax sp.]|nr:acyl-CoA dehydrogenase family protein [Pseudorhodoferax sp.]